MKKAESGILRKIFFLSIAIVVIFSVSILGSYVITRMEEDKCWQILGDSADSISREITMRVTESMHILHLAGETVANRDLLENRDELDAQLKMFQSMTIYERIDIIYPDKMIQSSDGTVQNIDFSAAFTDLSLRGEHLSIRMNDALNPDKYVVNYFVPVKDGKETIAILVGVLSCDRLTEVFHTKVYNGRVRIGIVDTSNGSFVMDNENTLLGNVSILESNELLEEYKDINLIDEVMAGRIGAVAYTSADSGKVSYMYYMPMGIDNWQLLVRVQEDVAFESLIQIRQMLISITISVLVVLTAYYVHAIIVNTRIIKTKDEIERKLLISDTLIECVRTLSDYEDADVAMNGLLKVVREFFDAERAYIFEIDYENDVINNSYEDIKEGVEPEIDEMQKIPFELVSSWIEEFDKSGMFIIRDIRTELDKDSDIYQILYKQNIFSMVAIPLRRDEVIIGFLGIDNPAKNTDDFSLISSMMYFLLDSIEKRETRNMLSRLSFEDKLTGLHNRNKFSQVMDDYESGECTAKSIGFAYYDLNGLKRLNDKFGHKAGDLLIQKVGSHLLTAFGTNAYRIGGDEFTVILPDVTEEAFRQMTSTVKNIMTEQGISISMGVSWGGENYNIGKQMMEADKAMYADKKEHYIKNDRRKAEE